LQKKEDSKSAKPKNTESSVTSSSKDNYVNKLSYNERREYNKLEKEIEKLEAKKLELSEQLTDSNLSPDELMKASESLGPLVEEIDEKSMRWLELSERA